MSRRIDITGQVFGQWTVLGFAHYDHRGEAQWKCRCGCGLEAVRSGYSLRSGSSTRCHSCAGRVRGVTHGHTIGHKVGQAVTKEYTAWVGMNNRCYNPKNRSFVNYGGRGIRVCDRWKESFETFFQDMGTSPLGHSLDRVDNAGDYDPTNCRWATSRQQNNNTRRTLLLEHEGCTLPLTEWARRSGLKCSTLCARLNRGWPVAIAIEAPLHCRSLKRTQCT